MPVLPNVIISTVGVSLWRNLHKAKENNPALAQALLRENWDAAAAAMAAPDHPDCGAEINSLQNLLDGSKFARDDADLFFCVSDTPEGRSVGHVLTAYYKRRRHRGNLHCVEIINLQDSDPLKFSRSGLRNLVIEIAKIVRQRTPQHVVVNATGGYKAQIALATLIGQALGVDVFYKHEKFPLIVRLPPMPIELDYNLFAENAALIDALETEKVVPLLNAPEKLLPLLEDVEVDGERFAELSAIGQIFLEGYRLRYPPEKTLPVDAEEPRKKPTYGNDHHYPKSFDAYVEKIWSETPYIKSCHTTSYSGQRDIRHLEFHRGEDRSTIIGTYKPDDFGARFVMETTAKTPIEITAAIEDLTRRYGRKPPG